jgi:Tol biopolymer transport system component
VWSPDGEWLAFSRIARDKDDGVYVQRADGSGQPTVALLAGGIEHSLTLTGWLPDGSGVLVTRLLGVRRDVVLVRIARDGTASPPEPVRVSPNNTDGCWVSPDGRLVLFGAEDSGRPELYVAEFRDGKIAGQPVPVGTAGQYHEARWGADGKRYYVRQDESKIMTGTIERSPVLRASPPALAWDLDTLNLVPGLFDITPDGRLLGLQLGQGEKDRLSAGIVLNWLDAARVKLRR